MIVLDPTAITTVAREPREVQKQRQAEAKAANRTRLAEARQRSEEKTKMKVRWGVEGELWHIGAGIKGSVDW